MSDISDIQALAYKLNLYHLARGEIDLSEEVSTDVAFLKRILSTEQSMREDARVIKRERESHLPRKVFEKERLNSGVVWQIEHLQTLKWIDEDQNLFIIGKCGTGKTSLVSHLGRKALEAGIIVSYETIESFIYTVENKHKIAGQMAKYKRWLNSSLIIVDDMMYAGLTNEELTEFYHTIMLLNETRSIVIITNRELSSWHDRGNDSHLMQTLIERLSVNSQIIRLT